MEFRSVYKYARISPKKARDVAREIHGLPVSDALDTLNFTPKKAAFLIGKTLKSAIANAENHPKTPVAADNLHVKEANVSEGPMFRRFKPRARGSASAIRKRTSHIYIIVTDEIELKVVAEEKPARARGPKRPGRAAAAPAKDEPAPDAEEEEAALEEEDVAAAEDSFEAEAAAETETQGEAESIGDAEDESASAADSEEPADEEEEEK